MVTKFSFSELGDIKQATNNISSYQNLSCAAVQRMFVTDSGFWQPGYCYDKTIHEMDGFANLAIAF